MVVSDVDVPKRDLRPKLGLDLKRTHNSKEDKTSNQQPLFS
jgi:hypothetical protein